MPHRHVCLRYFRLSCLRRGQRRRYHPPLRDTIRRYALSFSNGDQKGKDR